jgi:Amino acid permease N-terminal
VSLQVATVDITDEADDETSSGNNADDQPHNGDAGSSSSGTATKSKLPGSFRLRRAPYDRGEEDDDGGGSDDEDITAPDYDSYWETAAQKTFGHNTLETLPHADHYRNILSFSGQCTLEGRRQRPTLMELHEQDIQVR